MHISRAKRSASARKGVRTKARNKAKRRTAARRAAITRRKHRILATKKRSINRSPI